MSLSPCQARANRHLDVRQIVVKQLRLVTYNIRKGKGASGRQAHSVTALGQALAKHRLDILLCQEVFHSRLAGTSQSALLARALDLQPYYEPNKRRRIGHHGNAIFTSLPASCVHNFDISTNRIERRGALYARLETGGRPLHIVNVHLGLNQRQRITQVGRIEMILGLHVGDHEPVILAGDFNDWTERLDALIVRGLGLHNAFRHLRGEKSYTWHARRPMFNLDRVYVRNVAVRKTRRLIGDPWHDLSDHLPLWVEIEI
jgi:endonuclease/exonuclease/phosphatase family metal-dependent hydrolase